MNFFVKYFPNKLNSPPFSRFKRKFKKKMNKKLVKVVCLEGPHGTGKTFNLKSLSGKISNLIECVDEGFVPKVKTKFHPQSLFNETKWAIDWFENITKRCFFNEEAGRFEHNKVIVTDRSPYSACVYCPSHRKDLKGVIDGIRKEFESKGIILYNIYLDADKMLVQTRVNERLKKEQWRKRLGEDDPSWLKTVTNRYDSIADCFCTRISADVSEECCKKVIEFVKKLN